MDIEMDGYDYFMEMFFEKKNKKDEFTVVFNPPHTILKFRDGTVVKSTCSPEDTFNEYSGVMIALAKRYGPKSNTYVMKQIDSAVRIAPYESPKLQVGDVVELRAKRSVQGLECHFPLGEKFVITSTHAGGKGDYLASPLNDPKQEFPNVLLAHDQIKVIRGMPHEL